ncbi:MAG TPA: GNAT family N-acetyltransferase [Pseudonocardiaceae bacterium]|nr:GNAT family N-acetyltransferase [Pseudonocardiaceae bacterium]
MPGPQPEPPQPEPWPLRHLVLRTPRLTLRPDDDEGLYELAALALRGVHPPEQMPFRQAWTEQPPDDLVRGALQYHWATRSQLTPTNWKLNFLVRHDGRVIGEQTMRAEDFAITREVWTGSWLGIKQQRRGFGTEMRAAVLMLAYDHLGATAARSGAYFDNPASLRLSEKLGYRADGTATFARRGAAATEIRLLLPAAHFIRPQWTLKVDGLEGCRQLLGAD